MRILHTINSVTRRGGGPIEGIRQIGAENIAFGHSVEVASMDGPDDPEVKDFPMPVHGLGPGTFDYSYSARFVPWLRDNASRYDIVVVNGIWQYQLFGTWLALRKSSTPYVVFTHGMLDPWFRRTYPLKHIKKWLYWPWANYPALRDASRVIFTCDVERILARDSFWLYKAREAVVNYGTAAPGGDSSLQRAAFLNLHPELRNSRVALFLGRIHEKKGCDILIKAFAQTLAREPGWRLVFAGPDEAMLQSKLMSLTRRLDIAHRVSWAGAISGDLKWGAIRCAEMLVLPSHQENFGIVVVEALACGVPVLISDKVNIWREVRDDGAALVATDDTAGTASMLARWAGMSAGQRAAMAESARLCFMKRFEIGAAGISLIEILTSATLQLTASPGKYECPILNK